jgi:hypothetical protein
MILIKLFLIHVFYFHIRFFKFIGTTKTSTTTTKTSTTRSIETTAISKKSFNTTSFQTDYSSTFSSLNKNESISFNSSLIETILVNNQTEMLKESFSLTNSSTDVRNNSVNSSEDNLFLLLLLIIPALLVLIILGIFCYGRCVANFCFRKLSIRICPCIDEYKTEEPKIHPNNHNETKDQNTSSDSRNFDINKSQQPSPHSFICLNELDEMWLEKKFMPNVFELYTKSSIKKMTTAYLSHTDEEELKNVKRIVVILSKKFLNDQGKNTQYMKCLNEICTRDKNDFSFIIVSVGEVDDTDKKHFLNQLQQNQTDSKIKRLINRLSGRIKRNFGLNDTELLYWHDKHFWSKFFYLMPPAPVQKNAQRSSTPVIELRKYNKLSDSSSMSGTPRQPLPPLKNVVKTSVASDLSSPKETFREENELNLVTKPYKKSQQRIHPNNNNSDSHSEQSKQRQLIKENDVDIWRKISAITPDFDYYDYEPIGIALMKGNQESNVKRFGIYDRKLKNAVRNQIMKQQQEKNDQVKESIKANLEEVKKAPVIRNEEDAETTLESSLNTSNSSPEKKKKSVTYSKEDEIFEIRKSSKKNRSEKLNSDFNDDDKDDDYAFEFDSEEERKKPNYARKLSTDSDIDST